MSWMLRTVANDPMPKTRAVGSSGLLVLIFIAGLACGWGPPLPKEIAAESFVLKDSHGVIRASLSLTKAGECDLSLLDEKGVRRMSLTVRRDGESHVVCRDGESRDRAGLVFDGEPSFYLRGANGARRVLATVDAEHDSASLALYNEKGEDRINLSASRGMESGLAFASQVKDKDGAVLGTRGDGTPGLWIYDRDGARGATLGSDTEKTLGFMVVNKKGNTLIQIGSRPDESSVFGIAGFKEAPRERKAKQVPQESKAVAAK